MKDAKLSSKDGGHSLHVGRTLVTWFLLMLVRDSADFACWRVEEYWTHRTIIRKLPGLSVGQLFNCTFHTLEYLLFFFYRMSGFTGF